MMKIKRIFAWLLVLSLLLPLPGMAGEVFSGETGGCDHYDAWTKKYLRPTCTEDGYIDAVWCPDCEKIISYRYRIPALGHNFTKPTVIQRGDCTKEMIIRWDCSRHYCNQEGTETSTYPALGHMEHVWSGPAECHITCRDSDSFIRRSGVKTCLRCREELDPGTPVEREHEWKTYVYPGNCGTSGSREVKCIWCGYLKSKISTGCDYSKHNIYTTYGGKHPTCEKSGLGYKVGCACGAYERDEDPTRQYILPPLGHRESFYYKRPTCTESGYKDRIYCDRYNCDKMFYDQTLRRWQRHMINEGTEVPAHGHNFQPVYIKKEPTCTEPGQYAMFCEYCWAKPTAEDNVDDEIPALGTEHEWEEVERIYEEPSCWEGKKLLICKKCYEIQYEDIDPVGHDWSEFFILEEPTCQKAGMKCRVCMNCPEREYEEIDKLEHDWEEYVTKEATCKDTGKTRKRCTMCNKTVEGKTIPIDNGNHKWVTRLRVEPTCTKPGRTEGVECEWCGAVKTAIEEIPCIPHKEVNIPGVAATATKPGLTEGKRCSVCNTVIVAQQVIPAGGGTGGGNYPPAPDPNNPNPGGGGGGGGGADPANPPNPGGGGAGGGGGGGGGGAAPATIPVDDGKVNIAYTASRGTAALDMPGKKVEEIIEKSSDGEVAIDASAVRNATAAEMPRAALTAFSAADLGVKVELPGGSVALNQEAVDSIAGQLKGDKVSVELLPVKKESLSDTQKQAVKANDVIVDINIRSGGQKISEFNGRLEIQIPYSGPQPVAVWYLNEAGELEKVNCSFANGKVTFHLNHLSLYLLGQDTDRQEKWTNPFSDVTEKDWFYSAVKFACENKLMNGVSNDLFAPRGATTRGMIVTILHRLEGSPEPKAGNPFADVAENKYYSQAVKWAAGNQIVSGYGDGNFGPDDCITREQLAVIFMNYAKHKGYDTVARAELDKFTDSGKISQWAKDAMSWANAEALILGDGAKLNPADKAERCQAAAIFMRFIKNVSSV